jgi:cytochrome P450
MSIAEPPVSKVQILPPSIKGHFFTGNLKEFRSTPLEFLTTLAREGGDITSLNLVGQYNYFVNNADLIEKILVTEQRNFAKGERLRKTAHRILGNGLFTSDGDFWLRQRRLAQPAFHRQRIASYGDIMVNYTEKLGQNWKEGEVREIQTDMSNLTMEVVAKTLFDLEAGEEANRISHLFEEIVETYTMRTRKLHLLLLPEKMPFPTNLRFLKAISELDKIIYRLIAQRRQSGLDKGDLLSMLIQAQDEDGSRMTDQQLHDEVLTLVLAGHETTALTLAWIFCFLAQNPAIETKLQEELTTVLGGRLPTVEDLPKLVYTDKIVKETLRVRPPVWVFVRETTNECRLEGYTLPKGTTVFLSQWAMHYDPRYFNEPQKFDPERWTPEMQKDLPKYAYFPFGGGPRLCIGNTFALMEAVLVVATLAQRFRLTFAPGETGEIWPTTLTLRVKSGLKMVVNKR